ncbi:MAG TPA: glycoside hydrolase family 3 N-terminal domain-containing protein [Terriglobales bacterium]|nr:glycoside hydrolase family 3 N-terminal domain-containing protein [Terriglobales bacterium]
MLKRTAVLVILSAFLCFASDKDKFNPGGKTELTKDGEKWAQKTLKKLSREEKIGQTIMVQGHMEFQNTQSPAYLTMQENLKKYHLGGVIVTVRVDGPLLLRNQPYEAAILTNRLQKEAELPLLIAADFERGLSMRLLATPFFPYAMAFGATHKPEYVEAFGEVVARESRAIGVHWNFFPVADVNSNPQNPIINTRSFGEDPQMVGEMLAAYIRGSRKGGMLSTAKHFPGHGDTDTDSHLELARVPGSVDRLNNVELPPFQKAIDAGVDSIMVAHVTVPSLDPDPNKVATISHSIITDLLKNKMNFKGLIVTDAMNMRALTGIYKAAGKNPAGQAAVDAFNAGNDLILMPSDLEGAYNGLLQAAESGEIKAADLDERVLKILRAKASLGLHKSRLVNVDEIADNIARPVDLALAQEVADNAVTLVMDKSSALSSLQAEKQKKRGTSAPRAAYDQTEAVQGEGVAAIILVDDLRSDMGRVFERELRQRIPDAKIIYVDNRIAGVLMESVTAAVLDAKAVIVAAYAAPSAGRGTAGLRSGTGALLDRVLRIAGSKTAMVAMGNPYVALNFPLVQTYFCTFSNAVTSESAAVKALFGEIALKGKLPVTLPKIAERGTGIERAAAVTARKRPAAGKAKAAQLALSR